MGSNRLGKSSSMKEKYGASLSRIPWNALVRERVGSATTNPPKDRLMSICVTLYSGRCEVRLVTHGSQSPRMLSSVLNVGPLMFPW